MNNKTTEGEVNPIIIDKTLDVLVKKNITANAKLLYFALCSGVDEKMVNHYTQATLAELISVTSLNTIKKGLDELAENRLIEIVKPEKGKPIKNAYKIC